MCVATQNMFLAFVYGHRKYLLHIHCLRGSTTVYFLNVLLPVVLTETV